MADNRSARRQTAAGMDSDEMKKKVFVSGCYDMLHSGHVAFFEEAAKLGELYVGIGADSTVFELKGRRTVNPEKERLYMVKAIRHVHDAWINSGRGIMDFEQEVRALKPDIFFVNSDGYTTQKEAFCKELGIQLIVSTRKPVSGLPERSTTALRKECTIPYRVELCGGWLDQPFLNQIAPGAVITVSVEPDHEFNDRSGMATSSRKKAVEIWQTRIPEGDREELAKMLFCLENPPGTEYISGSQDQFGILLPGLNKLNYHNGYFPESIEKILAEDTLQYIENHVSLIGLPPREPDYDMYRDRKITAAAVQRLAESSEKAWKAILAKDTLSWGFYTKECLEAQKEIFPHILTGAVEEAIRKYQDLAYGWKLTGAGGGGYLILIHDGEIPCGQRIRICRN